MNLSRTISESLGRAINEEEDAQGLQQVLAVLDRCENEVEQVFKNAKISEFLMGRIREDLPRLRLEVQHRMDHIEDDNPVGNKPLFAGDRPGPM